MGKRSSFERIPRDFYPTPLEAVRPLLPHLSPYTRYIEPCAGDGALIDHLASAGHVCVGASDIVPNGIGIAFGDACEVEGRGMFITNPPWARKVLHAIILNLCQQAPTWLLFDADWIHTRQSAPYIGFLRKIVSVGRVKWIADSPFTGKDNCCWHLFDANTESAPVFVGRAA